MEYYVYILANDTNTSLYIGVTNELSRRIWEHRSGVLDGFTKRYHIHKLVYYEIYSDVNEAISREKKLKGFVRAKKNQLITSMNPEWNDLIENTHKNVILSGRD